MALFSAADLLANEQEDHTIQIDGFKHAGEKVEASVTIKVNHDIREIAAKAKDKHNNVKFTSRGKRKTEITQINEPLQYCQKVLDVAYVSSEGEILDQHNKAVFLALLAKLPAFAQFMASALMEYFDGADVFGDNDDEKN